MEIKVKERCFVIMPISDQGDYEKGHFTKVYQQIFKPAIEAAGYEAYRVDENVISDSIIIKIFEAIQNCPMAICDLSNRNPNVLYELGLRQAYDKPVVLLQDDKTDKIFDVSGISTVYYKSNRLYENVIDAKNRLTEAILATKEGKTSSIAKIIKVNTAPISTDSMSGNDRMEVLLRQVLSSINSIKNAPLNIKTNSNGIKIAWSAEDGVSDENGCGEGEILDNVEYLGPRPNMEEDEMAEIAKWAKEKFAPYVADVEFDELGTYITVTGCSRQEGQPIADRIFKKLELLQ